MSWQSKFGIANIIFLSDDEYWHLFNFVFSPQSKKTSTYKFALIKSILDNLFNNIPYGDFQLISYQNLFSKFAECFWNLVVKYHLHQQKPYSNGKTSILKTSKIEQIFGEAIQRNPILENLEFNSVDEKTKNFLISKVQTECKKYVLGALFSDFDEKIYSFSDNENFIKITNGAYQFMTKYKIEIEKLNYYEWAKFLEKINADNVLFHLLSKLELSLPEREPLDIYRKILFAEFEQCNCFYCGKKLSIGKIHVDHFIPWSFLKEDKLWNFVLTCPECNIKKSNLLPSEDSIFKIQNRNEKIIKNIKKIKKADNNFINQEFSNYSNTLLPNLWKYAKYAGFKIMNETKNHSKIYKTNPNENILKVAEP